jgi:hypothetical protein
MLPSWMTALAALACAALSTAADLPSKVYSTADGLANDTIHYIFSDSRGFLWFCTEDGLAEPSGFTSISYNWATERKTIGDTGGIDTHSDVSGPRLSHWAPAPTHNGFHPAGT